MNGEGNSIPSGAEAAKVNEILRTKYYDAGGVAWWWNSANAHLGGKTPSEMWLSEGEPSTATVEAVGVAAAAANIMGYGV
jgi:hypothetical protein